MLFGIRQESNIFSPGRKFVLGIWVFLQAFQISSVPIEVHTLFNSVE